MTRWNLDVSDETDRRVRLHPDRLDAFLANAARSAVIASHLPIVTLSIYPDDNAIMATAIAGRADLIISGDKRHMLSLGNVHDIPIINARSALDRLGPTLN